MLLRAVEIQRPLILANLRRLQRKHPRATAAQLAATLERDYLIAVTGGGALVGGAAVIPGVGTVAALGLSAAATAGFLEATALFATSLAELHGVRMVDPEKASTLVMAVMLGEEGTALLSSLSGQATGQGGGPTQAWGTLFARRAPLVGFGRFVNGSSGLSSGACSSARALPCWAGPCRSASGPSWAASATG